MTKKLTAAVFIAICAYAQERQEILTLRIAPGNISGTMLSSSKAEASWLLSHLGMRVRWIMACGDEGGAMNDISILVRDKTPADDHPGALGYSLPFAKTGFRVVIFYDRIATNTIKPSPKLLGHVIAHEVGHVLMGTMSHAPTGVMRAHWSRNDLQQIEQQDLRFTQGDIGFIQRRLAMANENVPWATDVR